MSLKNTCKRCIRALTLLSTLMAAAVVSAGDIPSLSGDDPGEILSPEAAFPLNLEDATSSTIVLHFAIQPGYYLYRDKFSIEPATPDIEITGIDSPPGTVHQDEFFGEVATWRDDILITAHLSKPVSQPYVVNVHYQGCADIGICYPPQSLPVEITPPEIPRSEIAKTNDSKSASLLESLTNSATQAPSDAPAPRPASPGGSVLGGLLGSNDNAEPELLAPEVAFSPRLDSSTAGRINISFDIAEGYYLYKDKTHASLPADSTASLTLLSSDAGKRKHDEFFGEVDVWRESASMVWEISPLAEPLDTTIELAYQGCADIGVCYPPQTTSLPVVLAAGITAPETENTLQGTGSSAISATPVTSGATTARLSDGAGELPATVADEDLSEQDRLARTLANNSLWTTALVFFGLGLLLAFTPCVLPMVPILSGLIVGQKEQPSTLNAFLLSLAFVLAMAVTYTVVGVLIGLSGENIQAWFQNPWVLWAFALLFVLLSLSMFGFYELQMPLALQNRLNALSNSQRGGTWLGVIIMGFLSALIVGPCVTAPLVGALIFIADTGDALTGGVALFALSIGMGTPLLLIGASAGKLLPRAGAWMEVVKAVFGVMMLGLAIWMLSRILDPALILALSAALCIISGIYLRPLDSLPPEAGGWQRFGKGIGVVLLVYGIALAIGALRGNHSLLQPLAGIGGETASSGDAANGAAEIEFRRVKSVRELDEAVALAVSQRQHVMLDFYADWCVTCKEMEAFTFTDSQVQTRMSQLVLLQADVTANSDQDKALLKRFGLFGPPAILLYDLQGQEQRNARVVGFMAADDFATHLDKWAAPSR